MMTQAAWGWAAVGARAAEHPWFAESRPAASAPSAPSGGTPAEDAGVAPAREPFHLNIADLWIGFETDYESRRVRSASPYRRDSTQENQDLVLRETAGMSLSGDLYDPNLFEYRAELEFGLTQTRFRETIDAFAHTSEHDTGFLQRYDVSVDALKSKPISLHAYARRFDDRVPRRFLSSLHEDVTEAGVSALALTGPVTTEIGYAFRDVDRFGNRLREDDESMSLSRFYLDSKWAIAEDHSLHVTWEHEREKNTYQGSGYHFNTSRDEFRVEHELAFGANHQHRLDTFLRYDTEKGDLARDTFEFVPRLTLQHTEAFKSIYRYGYYRFAQGDLDIGQHKFDVEGIYQATPDLRISGDLFALYEHVDNDVQTQQYGVEGEVTYHRATPWGEFNGDVNLGYDQAYTSGTAGRRYVRGEAHSMGAIRPVILRERHVIVGTILAHDDRFTRIFIPGVDYTVILVSGWATIQRVPWGRINEGDVVYFDYAYEVPATARVNSYRVDLRLEHTFTFGLTPYYYMESRFQQVDRRSLGTPLERNDQDRHRLGLRFARDKWTVGTEYEIFDDSVEPYCAWHVTGQASLFQTGAHALDLNTELSRYFFRGGFDRRRVWYFDIDLDDRLEITNLLSLTSGAEFRRECDDVRGDTTGVDAKCGLKYTRGYLTVELDIEYDLLSIVENRENGFGIFLNVRRDLSHLLPARAGVEQ